MATYPTAVSTQMIGVESVPACPVCNGLTPEVLHDQLTDRVSGIDLNVWTLYRCKQCQSGYLDPRLDAVHIGEAYRGEYYTHHATPLLEDEAPTTFRGKLRRAVRNGYLNANYGSTLRPSTILGAGLIPLLPAAKLRMDHWVRYVKSLTGTRRLLDLGCGHGAFLARMKGMGWDVQGIEPDPAAVAVARQRNLKVEQGILTAETFPADSFDAVTISHVIEHLHDPVGTLRLCHRLLRPGGILWISTPNLESQGHQRFGRYWVHLDPPRHLVLFTPSSLRDALRRAGFEVDAPLRNTPHAAVSYPWSAEIARADKRVPPTEDYADVAQDAVTATQRAATKPEIDEEIIYVARRA